MVWRRYRLTIDPCAQRLAILSDECASIVVKSHNHPILPLYLLLRPHDDRVPYIASLDLILSYNSS